MVTTPAAPSSRTPTPTPSALWRHVRLVLASLVFLVATTCSTCAVTSVLDRAMATPASRALTKSISIANNATTELAYSSSVKHAGAVCVNTTTGTNLFIVEEGAANTNEGLGPYCDTCIAGPVFSIGRAWARLSAGGPATVRCAFYEEPPSGALASIAGITKALADTLYLALTGGTLTGTLTFSGVTNDIATAGNEDLRLRPGGTGSVLLEPGDNIIEIMDEDGTTVRSQIVITTNANTVTWRTGTGGSNEAVLRLCNAGTCTNAVIAGSLSDNTDSVSMFRVVDNFTGGAVTLLDVFGEGTMVARQHTSGTMTSWRIPTGIAATVPTKPACTASTDEGRMIYVNDSDDGATAQACMCGRWSANDTTFSWALLSTLTASSCTL